jgi:hypothetical protein
MKYINDRPYGNPARAARKLVEIANETEAVQDVVRKRRSPRDLNDALEPHR